MEQGCSAPDFRRLLERLDRLETQVARQQATIDQQRRIIAEQRATIAAQHAALETAHEQIRLLKKALFAPKRERFVPAAEQQSLFAAEPEPPPAPGPAEPVARSKPRRPRRKFAIPDFLPVVRHEHKLDDAECRCGGCGRARTPIKTLVTRQIELERA